MVDVTSRFHAFVGHRNSLPFQSDPGSEYMVTSELADRLLSFQSSSSSQVYAIQEEIERVEPRLLGGTGSEEEKAHRAAIVSILYDRLRDAVAELQKKEMVKLQREMVIQKHFQPDMAQVLRVKKPEKLVVINDERPKAVPPSSQSARWNNEAEILLATYQTDTDQVVDLRRKLQETSALLSVLSTKAVEQEELAASVLATAAESIEHVEMAEDQLKRAIKHNDSFRTYVVLWFWCLSLILWLLHWIK